MFIDKKEGMKVTGVFLTELFEKNTISIPENRVAEKAWRIEAKISDPDDESDFRKVSFVYSPLVD